MAKLPKLRFSEPEEIRDFRRKHQMNQLECRRSMNPTLPGLATP